MNKLLVLLFGLLSLTALSTANALDIPSYIEDPQNVNDNIDIILQKNKSRSEATESAINSSEERKALLREYTSRLYALAISTRAQLANAKDTPPMQSKNKKAILNEIKEQVKNIGLRFRQIVELEAATANLQATKSLHSIEYTTDKEKQ